MALHEATEREQEAERTESVQYLLPMTASAQPAPAPGWQPPPSPVHLLFTCTANQIRSPYAEAVARRYATELRLAVTPRSAGTHPGGASADETMAAVAKRRGLDLSGHVSMQVTPGIVASSHLVVTMTGLQVLELDERSPGAISHTITLREWATISQDHGAITDWTPAGVEAWVAPFTERPVSALLSGRFDLADPVGRPTRVYRRTAETIEALVALCFGQEPPG